MIQIATFCRVTLLLALGFAVTAPALAGPNPDTGKDALLKLRDTLAFDGDPRAIVDARVQVDALLARPDAVPDTAAEAMRSLTGRVDAALAAASAHRPAVVAGPLPPLLPWWRDAGVTLAPLALIALSLLAGALAIAVQVVAGRRLLAAGTTAQAAMQAGGKLFESAARRFMQAQDDAAAITDNASASAAQAGQATARLTAAARDTDARLRMTLDDADARLRMTLEKVELRLRGALEATEMRLGATLEATEARLGAALEETETRLRGTDAVAQDIQLIVDALPGSLAQMLQSVTGPAVSAIEDASAVLRDSTQAVTAQLADEASGLPPLIADAILAVAARGLPAIEAATEQLITRAGDFSRAAGAMQASGAGLAATQVRLDASLAQMAGTVAATFANTERAEKCVLAMEDSVRAAGSWPAGIVSLNDAAASLRDYATGLADACARANDGAGPDGPAIFAQLAGRVDAALATARTAQTEDAAGAALILEALSARADAILGMLPAQADILAATAAQLRADAGDFHAVLATSLLNDLPVATRALVSAASTLAEQGHGLAGDRAQRDAAFTDIARGAASAMQDSAALLRECTAAAAMGLADAVAAATPANDGAAAHRQAAFEGAIAHIQTAAARVLAGAGAQELASARVAEAAREVAACFQAPTIQAPSLISLARLNGLAAETDILHAQADLLATAALRGHGRDLPQSLPHETPALLAAIEASIQKLRGTATALALASDAARAAA